MTSGPRQNEEASYTELGADAWHENEDGGYYIDCPQCGSAATLMNVARHGRCNGYLDQAEEETELAEEEMDCTAKLWFELGHVSDPDGEGGKEETSVADVETEEGVPAEGSPPGADGAVGEDGE